MAKFPTSLDSLTNPTNADALNSPAHASQHGTANDILELLEAKVGVDNSAVATSIDYFLKHASGTFELHNHSNNGAQIVAGGIATDAVTSAKIIADAVTAAKMIYGMVLQRQGGTSGDGSWITAGTTNTDTSAKNIFIQAGAQTTDNPTQGPTNGWYYTNLLTVTFPTAYNQIPLVFPVTLSGTGVPIMESQTTTNFTVRGKNPASAATPIVIGWVSIGQ